MFWHSWFGIGKDIRSIKCQLQVSPKVLIWQKRKAFKQTPRVYRHTHNQRFLIIFNIYMSSTSGQMHFLSSNPQLLQSSEGNSKHRREWHKIINWTDVIFHTGSLTPARMIRDVVSVSTSRSRDVVSKRLGLVETWEALGLDLVTDWKSNVSVSYHRVSFTSPYAQLFASLQNCTYIVYVVLGQASRYPITGHP